MSESGGYIEVKPQYFEQIPIPNLNEPIKNELNKITEVIINEVSEKHKLRAKFLKLLKTKFPEIKLTKKLDHWFKMDFTEFLKELKKQKVKLTLNEESEWMDYFENSINRYLEIDLKIKTQDKEIDQMVYKLYGLTEEEIQIVEENVG